jgi:branched-subunit amino acid transport protein
MAALVISMLTTPEGQLAAGLPEIVGLCCAAITTRLTGNHILSLMAGMVSFWLLSWLT